jgi:hypothetical protein
MALAYRTKAQAALGSGDPINCAFTTTTGDTLLVCCIVGATTTSRTGGAPTWGAGGTPFIQAGTTQAGSAECTAELWYLKNPAIKADNIVVQNDGTLELRVDACVFTGQSPNLDQVTQTGTSAAQATLTLNNVPAGSVVVDVLGHGRLAAPTEDGDGTALYNDDEGAYSANCGYSEKVAAGTVTHSWTASNTDDVAMVMASFKEDVQSINVNDAVGLTDVPTMSIPVLLVLVASLIGLTDYTQVVRHPLDVNVSDNVSLTDSVKFSQIPYLVTDQITSFINAGYRFQRKLARTSNGDLHCIYTRNTNRVYYAKSVDNGETWTETQLDSYSGSETPCIAIDGNDYLHVAWIGSDGVSNEDQLRYRKFTTSWQAVETLTTEGDYEQTTGPAIVIDSSNVIHIVWCGKDSSLSPTYAQVRYIKNTGSWSAISNLTSGNYTQEYACLAIGPNDNLHVAWRGNHAGSTTYTRARYIRYTDAWQSIEDLTSDDYHSWDPCLAVDSSGNIHCVYTKAATIFVNGDIKYRIRTTSWQGEVDITTEGAVSSYDQLDSGIAIDGAGNLHVAWEGEHAGSPTIYQVRYRLYNGSWQAIENLTSYSVDQRVPNLIWAYWPLIAGNRTNRPAMGYAFIWANDDAEIRYQSSSDLGWEVSSIVYDLVDITDEVAAEIITGAVLNASAFDDVSLTDEVAAELTLYEIAGNDSVTVTDDAQAVPSPQINVADDVGISDEVPVQLALYEIAVSDLVDVAEAVTSEVSYYEISVFDSINATDITGDALTVYEISVFDSVVTTDTTEASLTLYEAAAFDLCDVAEFVWLLPPTSLEISVFDLVHIHPAYRRPVLDDSIGITDSVALETTPLLVSVFDSIGTTDAPNAYLTLWSPYVSDTIPITDGVIASLTLYEAIVYDDIVVTDNITLSPEWGVNVSDSVALSDQPLISIPVLEISVYDDIGLTDYTAQELTYYEVLAPSIPPDEISIDEWVKLELSYYEISVNDSVGVSDSNSQYITNWQASVFDSMAVTDYVEVILVGAGLRAVNVADTIGLTDVTTDALTLYEIAAYDTIAVSDSTNDYITVWNLSVSDNLAVTDSVGAFFTFYQVLVGDSINVTDYVLADRSGIIRQVNVFDTIALTDSASVAWIIYPFLQATLDVAANESILVCRDTGSVVDVADTGSLLTVTR